MDGSGRVREYVMYSVPVEQASRDRCIEEDASVLRSPDVTSSVVRELVQVEAASGRTSRPQGRRGEIRQLYMTAIRCLLAEVSLRT